MCFALTPPESSHNSVTDDLCFFFVADAPAQIQRNIAPQTKNVANGTMCTLHSLSFRDPVTAAAAEQLKQATEAGEILMIPRQQTVNVVVGPADTPLVLPLAMVPAKAEESIKGKLKKVFSVDPAFAFTFHKVQGVTCDRVALALHRKTSLTFAFLYVAMSRVTSADGLTVLPSISGHGHLLGIKKYRKELLEFGKEHHLS